MEFGLGVGSVKREIPSASLRAGSSLRLKNGSAHDDNRCVIVQTAPLQGRADAVDRNESPYDARFEHKL